MYRVRNEDNQLEIAQMCVFQTMTTPPPPCLLKTFGAISTRNSVFREMPFWLKKSGYEGKGTNQPNRLLCYYAPIG